ncbi:hypothetical protein PBI_DISMAS_38 [Microbacterium phage Dismas]|uniref:Uncharacterized protein n=1 Tax=Microbacterium phage Dismas TaxID=2065199 RepID=A0A2H5BFR2_9CAUD|nr:hypothetical protein FDJ24_gp38 [Microbacterium phage Dismas]AUG84835.1 hypothetical protein PBI_DISMAS_38 [Microbacterium phage Dismas]
MDAVDQLNIMEAAANFADLAATFRDALTAREFSTPPAEQTALMMASAMFGQSLHK